MKIFDSKTSDIISNLIGQGINQDFNKGSAVIKVKQKYYKCNECEYPQSPTSSGCINCSSKSFTKISVIEYNKLFSDKVI
jgi:hypothetical protein